MKDVFRIFKKTKVSSYCSFNLLILLGAGLLSLTSSLLPRLSYADNSIVTKGQIIRTPKVGIVQKPGSELRESVVAVSRNSRPD